MKNQLSIREAGELEEIFQVFYDIEKRLYHDKHTDKWSWYDRDEEGVAEAYHTGFDTALAAMEDEVEPYLNPE
jgi:hypothetical protein